MSADLYSFIASRDGEVFTSQVNASCIEEACLLWGNHFVSVFIRTDFDESDFLEDLSFKVEMLSPVPIENTDNMWCLSFLVLDEAMWVHIVKTEIVQIDILA